MDGTRQVYAKQNSNTGTPVTSSSPMASPLNRHTRMGSTTGLANARKAQNAKAAAQRLAHVMAHQAADEDDEEDDLLYDYGGTRSLGLGGGRAIRSRSPMVLLNGLNGIPHDVNLVYDHHIMLIFFRCLCLLVSSWC